MLSTWIQVGVQHQLLLFITTMSLIWNQVSVLIVSVYILVYFEVIITKENVIVFESFLWLCSVYFC